jgi:hypothetical protein
MSGSILSNVEIQTSLSLMARRICNYPPFLVPGKWVPFYLLTFHRPDLSQSRVTLLCCNAELHVLGGSGAYSSPLRAKRLNEIWHHFLNAEGLQLEDACNLKMLAACFPVF